MNNGLRFLDMNFAEEAMKVHLYYPSCDAESSFQLGPYTLTAAVDGKEADGQFPLVIISHGTGSSPLVWRDLARYLAKQKFVVACIEHPHNNRTQNDRADTVQNLLERPLHILKLVEDLKYYSWIDSRRIQLIGHSLGAYTVLCAAGAKGHTKHQIQYDNKTSMSESVDLPGYSIPSLQSIILLNPAAVWFLGERSLSEVKVPILMITGTKDVFTPRFHGELIERDLSKHLKWIEVENAGHFSFMSPFPAAMISEGFAPGNDPAGFDRQKFQKTFFENILEFLVDRHNSPSDPSSNL